MHYTACSEYVPFPNYWSYLKKEHNNAYIYIYIYINFASDMMMKNVCKLSFSQFTEIITYLYILRCERQKYEPDLPKASIIICFYNEAWSTLLRTIHTIIDRTPPNLLEEIILIDDCSDMGMSCGFFMPEICTDINYPRIVINCFTRSCYFVTLGTIIKLGVLYFRFYALQVIMNTPPNTGM